MADKYIIDFPELRQISSFDCGVSALQSILIYYGFDEREDRLMKKLSPKTTDIENNGVLIKDIIRVAKTYGLQVELKRGLKAEDLIPYIKKDIPVMILVQAWRDDKSPKSWIKDYKDGHWVDAIGYSINKIIFEDPSAVNRTFLTFNELNDRWHGVDDDNKPDEVSVAIIIKGKKKFKAGTIIHMD
jgi:predicted double-glycine peptidase